MLNVCGLWKRTSKKGREYLTGRLAGTKVLILENTHKQTEGDPDYQLVLTQALPRQDDLARRQEASYDANLHAASESDTDISF